MSCANTSRKIKGRWRLLRLVLLLGGAVLSTSAQGAIGDIFEADYGTGNVFEFTPTGVRTTFLSGLVHPSGLALDRQGNLFVSDAGAGTILKVTPTGAKTLFASGLNNPFGLAFDSNGNLFVADNRNQRILKFTPAGVSTVFATGLNGPAGLAIDRANTLFESDINSGNIFAFTPAGVRSTVAAGLGSSDGLYSDGAGDLLAGDVGTGQVIAVSASGAKSVFASGFGQPTGVTVDLGGNTFISDNQRGTITKITPAGVRTIFATGLFNPQYLAIEHPTGQLANISTRAFVGTGQQVLIGGFIVTGTAPKEVLLRGLGPTLSNFKVVNPLPDPTLTLHNSAGSIIAFNNDWQTASNSGQIPVAYRPPDPRESAILISLPPGNYTAAEAGNGGSTGVGLVEVYDMAPAALAQLANISSRGLVQSNTNPMIGGFIASGGNGSTTALVRALGPTLGQFGVSGTLPNPTVQLVNAHGQVLATNDDWQTTQAAAIRATGLAPPSDLEAAILITLANANYTAIVKDQNGASGVALVEVYQLP